MTWVDSQQLCSGVAVDEACVRKYVLLEKLEPTDAQSRQVRFVFSDGSVDRDNDIIDPAGWDLTAFKGNPVILWAHSHRDLPVGRAVSIGVENDKLVGVVEFAMHPFAQTVFELVKGGFLRAVSVGFRALEYAINEERRGIDFKRQELLETSLCPVPANANALIAASASGVDLEPLRQWLQETIIAWPDELKLKGKAWEKLRLAAGEPQLLEATLMLQTDEAMAKLATLQASLDDTIAKADTLTGKLTAPAVTLSIDSHALVDALDYDKGVSPRDVSATLADRDTSWSAPRLSDFTTDAWSELSATQRRRIAGHYAWAAAMPPAAFSDLKGPHHRPSDGAVVFRGIAAAAGRMNQMDIPAADMMAVRAHLGRHYRAFEMTPPWERHASAWEAYLTHSFETEALWIAALRDAGFAVEADALLADTPSSSDVYVLELSDDDGLELADEDSFEVDPTELSRVISSAVADAFSGMVRESTERTINTLRGRLD